MQTSKEVKSTATPTYNHTVQFKISAAEVTNKTVVLQVWNRDLLATSTLFVQVFDKDTFSKDDPLGEVQIPLWHTDVNKVAKIIHSHLYFAISREERPGRICTQ